MSGSCIDSERETGVVLGFLEEAEPWQLASAQFPSKVGGRPAWLSQLNLPSVAELVCEKCQLPTVFLLQVYAPIVGQERSFHRTLYVFCCKTPACYTANDNRCCKGFCDRRNERKIKQTLQYSEELAIFQNCCSCFFSSSDFGQVYRSQLPRKNDFYPYDPPPDEEPATSADDKRVLGSGVKLCRLCGCAGHKACSRCHTVTYCSKEHQAIDWKKQHKKECNNESSSVSDAVNMFLFPEWELVTEPEELPAKDDKPSSDSLEQPNIVSSDLEESELESMALHESQDSKMFQKFKECIAAEPHQVLRYRRQGSPLWVSSEHVPSKEAIPKCLCGTNRVFEFQIMPQLLNHLKVDRTDASIDWGTLAIYTCAASCDQGNNYSAEFIWKQDFSADQTV